MLSSCFSFRLGGCFLLSAHICFSFALFSSTSSSGALFDPLPFLKLCVVSGVRMAGGVSKCFCLDLTFVLLMEQRVRFSLFVLFHVFVGLEKTPAGGRKTAVVLSFCSCVC